MKSRVFLSQVTEAFRKDTNTDHESAEGRLLWPGMLSASSFLIFRIDLQNLESGPHPPLQKVDVEEAFKVCNSQELTVEANKDKRLIKKKNGVIHQPHSWDPGVLRPNTEPRSYMG